VVLGSHCRYIHLSSTSKPLKFFMEKIENVQTTKEEQIKESVPKIPEPP